MTTGFVAVTSFTSAAAQQFTKLVLAIKIVTKSFMARANTGNDVRARCANGNYRRAHHRRDGGNLRGGNCNPVGKAGWKSPRKTRTDGRAVCPLREMEAQAAKRPRLPARETHYVKCKEGKRERPEQTARWV